MPNFENKICKKALSLSLSLVNCKLFDCGPLFEFKYFYSLEVLLYITPTKKMWSQVKGLFACPILMSQMKSDAVSCQSQRQRRAMLTKYEYLAIHTLILCLTVGNDITAVMYLLSFYKRPSFRQILKSYPTIGCANRLQFWRVIHFLEKESQKRRPGPDIINKIYFEIKHSDCFKKSCDLKHSIRVVKSYLKLIYDIDSYHS